MNYVYHELLAANLLLGLSLTQVGENAASAMHFERVRNLCDPNTDAALSLKYMTDFLGIGSYVLFSLPLLALGYLEQAMRMVTDGVAITRTRLPVHLAAALNFGAHIPLCRGEASIALQWAEECIDLCDSRGMAFYGAFARVNRGAALARVGRASEGVVEIREALPGLRAGGLLTWEARHLAMLVEACIAAGYEDEALRWAEDALASVRRTGERQFEALVLIAKGDAVLTAKSGSAARAEGCYSRALDIARAQSAKMWELRAATRLARLWHTQGKTIEARELLAPVYGWFTEGFDTADLIEAKALLDELS